jgi:hypothetical protein
MNTVINLPSSMTGIECLLRKKAPAPQSSLKKNLTKQDQVTKNYGLYELGTYHNETNY